jgi:hypothetical protein
MRKFDPGFTPEFTPRQMLALGVFGGAYFNESERREFPRSWFTQSRLSTQFEWVSASKTPPNRVPSADLNAFGVLSGQSRKEWMAKGWINEQDPLGWFQWYCRYYRGRRTQDDARQIKRWRAFKRHSAQVAKRGNTDMHKRSVQRQALLQWGYDPFPDFYENIRATFGGAYAKFIYIKDSK